MWRRASRTDACGRLRGRRQDRGRRGPATRTRAGRGARRDCRVRDLRIRSAHGPGALRETGCHSRPRVVGHCGRGAEGFRVVRGRPSGGKCRSGVRGVPALPERSPFGVPAACLGGLRRVPGRVLPVQDGGGRRPDPDSRRAGDAAGGPGRTHGDHAARAAPGRRPARRSGARHRSWSRRAPDHRGAARPGDLRHHGERAVARPPATGPRRRCHSGGDARRARGSHP